MLGSRINIPAPWSAIWVSRTWASPSPKGSPCLSTFLSGRKYVHLISISYLSLMNFKRLMWNNLEQLSSTNCSQSNYLVTILKWPNRWNSIISTWLISNACGNTVLKFMSTSLSDPGTRSGVLSSPRRSLNQFLFCHPLLQVFVTFLLTVPDEANLLAGLISARRMCKYN